MKTKTAWGDIKSISFTRDRNKKGVLCDYYAINNGKETLLFKTEQFSPTLGCVSSFSKALVQIILEKGYGSPRVYISSVESTLS